MHPSPLANLKIGSLSWDITFNYPSQNTAPGNSCRNTYCRFLPAPNTHNKSLKTTKKNFLNSTNHTQATITLLFKKQKNTIVRATDTYSSSRPLEEKLPSLLDIPPLVKISRVTDHMNNLQHQLQT